MKIVYPLIDLSHVESMVYCLHSNTEWPMDSGCNQYVGRLVTHLLSSQTCLMYRIVSQHLFELASAPKSLHRCLLFEDKMKIYLQCRQVCKDWSYCNLIHLLYKYFAYVILFYSNILIFHGFFTKSRTKNVTFKITSWIHNRAKVIGSATYNFT